MCKTIKYLGFYFFKMLRLLCIVLVDFGWNDFHGSEIVVEGDDKVRLQVIEWSPSRVQQFTQPSISIKVIC